MSDKMNNTEKMQELQSVDTASFNEATQMENPKMYTEEQLNAEARAAYIEGQRSGYVAAVRQIRADLADYLNDLIVKVEQGK